MTRWQAGQAESLDLAFSLLLGRELGPDDVEPLTWALAQEGRDEERRAVPGAP